MSMFRSFAFLLVLLFVSLSSISFASCSNLKSDEFLVGSEYGWASGTYTDATVNVNFHTTSTERSIQIGDSFTAMCYVSTDSAANRFLLHLASPNATFPQALMEIPKGIPTGTSNTPVQLHRILQVWAYFESLNQPIIMLGFPDNRTAKSEMRLLVPTGAAGYKPVDPADPNAKTMYYKVRFELRALRPGFYGTRAGIPTRETDGTYSVRITAKFPDKAREGTTLFTPLSTSLTNIVPFSQTRVFVRLLQQDASAQGEWVHVLEPQVETYQLPTYDGTNPDYEAERNGVYESSYSTSIAPPPSAHGIISGAVDQYGYVNLVIKNLTVDANFSCYVAPVPTNSNLEILLNNGIHDPDYIMPALTALTQPMIPCRFKTPPAPGDLKGMARPVAMWSGSCIEGPTAVWDGVAERDYDVIIWNGDLGYNDNLGKYRPDDTGSDEPDFISNYDRAQRDEGIWKVAISAAGVHTKSDHEVQDAWLHFPVFSVPNSALWLYTAEELALVNAVASVPLNKAMMPISKPAVVPNGNLVKNQRVVEAYTAFDRVFPGGAPYNKNQRAQSWAEDRGQVLLIKLDSNPTLHSDGSIQYYTAQTRVPMGGESSPVLQNAPGVFIPNPAFDFFKSTMLSEKARVKAGEIRPRVAFVVFSDRITPTYSSERVDKYRNSFIQMASVVSPSTSSVVAESAFNKTFYQARGVTSDVFQDQFADLKKFIADNDLSNIVFLTGDAHNSIISPIDESRSVWEACSSSTGNYQATGTVLQFLGNPLEKASGSVGVMANSYAHVESNAFPDDPKEKPYVEIKLMYGRTVQARRKILLRKSKG